MNDRVCLVTCSSTPIYPLNMKLKVLLLFSLFFLLTSSGLFSQEHISHYFDMEEEFVLPPNSCAYLPGKLIGCVSDGKLFFCRNEAVKNAGKAFVLSVEVVDLQTHGWQEIHIQLPPLKKHDFLMNRLWISSLQIFGNRMIVVTDFNLLVYELTPRAELKLLNSWDFPDADYGFYVGKKYYGMSQVNDYGFVMRTPVGSRLDSVVSFPMSAPFLLQYGPNGFLKQFGENLYFVDPPSKVLRILDLSGKVLRQVDLDIPDWNPLPDSYIREIKSMPYGGDRALRVFSTSTQYSFPLEVAPLNEKDILIAYHHGSPDGFKILFLLLRLDSTEAGRQLLLTTEFAQDHSIDETEFPFYFSGRVLRLSTVAENTVLQLVKTSNVRYEGKSWEEYSQAENEILEVQRPDVVVRVMRLRPSYPELRKDSLPLIEFAGQAFEWDSIPMPRAMFLLNRPPQCHACEEQLAAFANTLGLKGCMLYVVDSYADSFMRRRECMEVAAQRLNVPFKSLFLSGADSARLPLLFKNSSFPMVLLWERGSSQLRVVSDLNLFPDSLMETGLRQETQEYLRLFAR